MRQEADALAAALRARGFLQIVDDIAPTTLPGELALPALETAVINDRLRAIGIVKIVERCLRERVGRALRDRMIGITLDLRRAVLVALDQEWRRAIEIRTGRGKEERRTGDQFLRLVHVRNDRLFRLACTRRQACD